MTVLVLGATGNVGPHVVRALLDRGADVRVLTRNSARAGALLGGAVDVRQGDLADEATLVACSDGVSAAFLLTPHAFDMADVQLRVIRAVRRSGVRIVKLSGTASAIRPDGPHVCRQHWEIEQVLRACGQPFSILRPNSFMQSLIGRNLVPTIRASGIVPNPLGTAGLSLIDAGDVGRVAAAVLTEDRWAGHTLTLTGPEPVSYARIAELVTAVRGEVVTAVDVSPADVRKSLTARGVPAWEAGHFEEMYELFGRGESAFVTDEVAQVTGRTPATVADYITQHAAAFLPEGVSA